MLRSCSASLTILSTFVALAAAPDVCSQTAWGPQQPDHAPPARANHVLVHDPVRQRTLMFGGWSNGAALNDTWEWNGEDWRLVVPATVPPARWNAQACYDDARGTVVMFGGHAPGTGYLGDTWEWNGTDWVRLAIGGPPAREMGGLAYDAARQASVLFGGFNGGSMGDMWELSAGAWRRLLPSQLPPANADFLFCAAPDLGQIVLHGGQLNDTWTWDGVTWTREVTMHGRVAGAAAAYDPHRRRIVAFGGNRTADTWEWDGSDWLRRSPGLSPPSRSDARAAWVTTDSRILLFGGEASASAALGDTWEYFHFTPSHVAEFGTGCRGSLPTPPHLLTVDDSHPWLAETWHLRVEDIPMHPGNAVFGLIGTSNTSWNGLPLPFHLAVIGMPGCDMLTSGDQSTETLVNRGGHADWNITFPLDLRLIGWNMYLQAVAFDFGANAMNLILSNGMHGRIGMK